MRLLHFDGKTCKHMTEIMPGIKATYQMEQEFYPYLDIWFMSYDEHNETKSGIILHTKNGDIKRYYDFKNKKELDELRDLIWYYLLKEVNITDITDKDGCLKDFRTVGGMKACQGWKECLAEHKKHVYLGVAVKQKDDKYPNVLDKVYRLQPDLNMTAEKCRKLRMVECKDNFLPGTPTYNICKTEVEWLCDHGFRKDGIVAKRNKVVRDELNDIYSNLALNKGFVSKAEFDRAIEAGLFYRMGQRSGNIVADYKKQNKEGFDGINVSVVIIILALIGILVWYYLS